MRWDYRTTGETTRACYLARVACSTGYVSSRKGRHKTDGTGRSLVEEDSISYWSWSRRLSGDANIGSDWRRSVCFWWAKQVDSAIAVDSELARAFFLYFYIRFGIRFGLWSHEHSILQVVDIRFDSTTTNLLLHDCLATASLPFSLTRQEHPTKTNTSRILLFDTRRVGTSKRSNLEA
jgi:hypothetical protein